MDAAKKKSLPPGSLALVRMLVLLVVTLLLAETRVWGLTATPQHAPAKSLSQVLHPSGKITPAPPTMRHAPLLPQRQEREGRIRENNPGPHGGGMKWLSERLEMKGAANASQQIKRGYNEKRLPKNYRNG